MKKRFALILGLSLLFALFLAGALAPEYVSTPELDHRFEGFFEAPPFGTDERGIPLHEYAMQGAYIVAFPAVAAACFVMGLATIAGLVRCADIRWIDALLQVGGEILGALPRMVVILVVAVSLPYGWKILLPIALVWAVLASPSAMDEAAVSAARLGGSRFVEALQAHGFSATRIYLYHVVWLNLRPVIVRQGAEVFMQVVFLEIALSYLAIKTSQPSFTHAENLYSWATLLYQGYTWMLGQPLFHAMVVGVGLISLVVVLAQSLRIAARAR